MTRGKAVTYTPNQRARDEKDARISLRQFFSEMGISNETVERALCRLELPPAKKKSARLLPGRKKSAA
jgi:hypothetical protein